VHELDDILGPTAPIVDCFDLAFDTPYNTKHVSDAVASPLSPAAAANSSHHQPGSNLIEQGGLPGAPMTMGIFVRESPAG
jgi:hypothetical protein